MAQAPQELYLTAPIFTGIAEHVLTVRRAERDAVSQQVHDTDKKLTKLRAALANLDAAIGILSPDHPDYIAPRKPKNRYFGVNELARLVRETLRDAGRPLSAGEVAAATLGGPLTVTEPATASLWRAMVLQVHRWAPRVHISLGLRPRAGPLQHGVRMSDKAIGTADSAEPAFRAACRSTSGLITYKNFADLPSAQSWAIANIKTFHQIAVEWREADVWKTRATFYS